MIKFMSNFTIYFERIFTDESKASLKQLLGKSRIIIGFSRLHATLNNKAIEHHSTYNLIGQGTMIIAASVIEADVYSQVMQFDIWHPAFLKLHYTPGQQPVKVSCQYFPNDFWKQYNTQSCVYTPSGLHLTTIALIYMESICHSYDITTRETFCEKIGVTRTEISEQSDVPATFSHLTEVWRLLTYIVFEFDNGSRAFIEFTDNPYGYGITYHDSTSNMWEKITETIDDDTGLKMYSIEYV